jgi:nucleoside-diphosphate-sugar epimerase
MRILVTGADGFLGASVVRALSTLGGEVLAVTRRGSGGNGRVVCDLADPAAVNSLMADQRPDSVVNLAARIDFNPGSLSTLYSVNALCPAIIAEYLRRSGGYMVHASTVAVHPLQSVRLNADSTIAPETDYGKSKWLAEQAIVASGCRSAIIRFGGIFGVGGAAHLGLNRAITQAREGQPPMLVGSGRASRNYIYVEDAALAVSSCVGSALTGLYFGAGQARSMREMLQAICDVWLPGQAPISQAGAEARDQVIDASPELGRVRTFREALEHAR